MTDLTQEKITSALRASGTNLCAWARSRGYPYTTVHTTVGRWAGRSDRTPHGGMARTIMQELSAFVDGTERRKRRTK